MYTLECFSFPFADDEASELKSIFKEVSPDFFNNFLQQFNNCFDKLSIKDVIEIETQMKQSLARMTGADRNSSEVDFLSKMLHLIPSRRWTAEELLQHAWLTK